MKFLEKYNNPKNIRFESFEETFRLSLKRKHKISEIKWPCRNGSRQRPGTRHPPSAPNNNSESGRAGGEMECEITPLTPFLPSAPCPSDNR